MKIKKKSLNLTLIIIGFIGIISCRQQDTNNRCMCTNNGVIVIDTTYHMEYDQAYQLCSAKEGNQGTLNCKCSKL